MNLEEIFGKELATQIQTAITTHNAKPENKDKQVKLGNLGSGEYVVKEKFDTLESEKANLEGQIKELNKTIEALKAGNKDNETLQTTIKELEGKLEASKKELETIQEKADKTSKTYALKEQLTKAGVTDADYIIYKAGGLEKFNFDKEGKPVGVEDSIKPYREDKSMAHLFKEQQQHYDPAGGGKPPVGNPFAKDTYNLTEQTRIFKEDPAQARELAAAAGVSL